MLAKSEQNSWVDEYNVNYIVNVNKGGLYSMRF
jgi:hypothetical protein